MYFGSDVAGEWLNGCAAALKVYNVVLTADELKKEMRCYTPVRTDNLNGWYPMLLHTDLGQYGPAWTAGGTLATENGPPIAWSLRPSMRSSQLPYAPLPSPANYGMTRTVHRA